MSIINANAPKRDKLLSNLPIHQEMKEIIYYGTLAPSSHNAQMWKVKVISDNEIMVMIDKDNVLPALDPTNRESFIAIGGFIENIAQAAPKYKLIAKIDILSKNYNDIDAVRIRFEKLSNSENSDKKTYNIENRLSINDAYLNKKLNQKDVDSLISEIEEENGYYFDVNSANGQYIQQNLIAANKKQASDKKKQEELASYMRLSNLEANTNKDGITAEMIGLTGLKKWLYYTFTTKKSITSDSFIKLTVNKVKSQVNNCSGFFIVTSTDNSPEGLINGGRNMERLWLKGIELKVALHPMCQIIEEKPWKEDINRKLNIDRPIQMIMRTGYVKKYGDPVSLRRSIDDIVILDSNYK
ncbi:nitroreductase [Clostridium pasteurianum]|uniref:Nitroreductase family protein n=1 Tax=Clostridium pasteurianum BC1 TaxID=86416 RepID=R4KC06_CLOPA|nr:nitroreductase [Clostridium pasteurianum]AGK98044.1 nitroreductase family protein [Clostridium pasteurianum BC1]